MKCRLTTPPDQPRHPKSRIAPAQTCNCLTHRSKNRHSIIRQRWQAVITARRDRACGGVRASLHQLISKTCVERSPNKRLMLLIQSRRGSRLVGQRDQRIWITRTAWRRENLHPPLPDRRWAACSVAEADYWQTWFAMDAADCAKLRPNDCWGWSRRAAIRLRLERLSAAR